MTVSALEWEEETFFTGKVRRMTSLMWLSHMPHIIPSIFKVIFCIAVILSSAVRPEGRDVG